MKYSIKIFLKNIKFLMRFFLKDYIKDNTYMTMLQVEDYCRYELFDENIQHRECGLDILNYEETVDLLLSSPKSFCRFGDGEINLINGCSIAFQKYDPGLQRSLLHILKEDNPNLYIGINYNYFHATNNLCKYNRKFYLLNAKPYRDFLLENCNRNRTYIAASFNQLYMFYDEFDYENYYMKIKLMFKEKKLVIFSGKGIFENIVYDIFELAKNKEHIWGPSHNAYDEYESILEQARKYPKDCVLCFILGPASKVLVYQLTLEGYLAWDIGHLAKDYDSYRKGIRKTDEEVKKFYAPD